jgi:hypothetical protein
VGRCGLDASDSGYGLVADTFDQGNETSRSIKGRGTIGFSRRTLLLGVRLLIRYST